MTQHGIGSEHMPAVDAAAWSLLALLLFCILCLAIGAWVLWRRGKRRSRFTMESLEELHDIDTSSPDGAADNRQKKTSAPWERDENWWK